MEGVNYKQRRQQMNRTIMTELLCACIGFTACIMTGTPVHAEETPQIPAAEVQSGNVQTITVTAQQIADSSAYSAIQRALRAAEEYDGTTEITVEPGTYTLSYCLDIFSNTTLHLEGVTLVRNREINMLHIGDSMTAAGYYYHDIKVTGGTFDHNKGTTVCIKCGHARNLTFEGVTSKTVSTPISWKPQAWTA
jgi:hypothetical protein